MKAAFAYKMGPLTTFGDGEVDLEADGLRVRFPKELAKKLKMGEGFSAKEAAKTGALFTILGPASMALEKGKPVTIPYSAIKSLSVKEIRYGVFGKKRFISVKIEARGKTAEFIFAPFTGTVKRNFKTDEFMEELRSMVRSSSRTVKKAASPKKKRSKARRIKRVEVEPEPVIEELEYEEEYEGLEEVETEPVKPVKLARKPMSRKLKYCPGCGEEIRPEFRFCPYCGFDLQSI